MKALIVGDLHFCDTVPLKRTDDFFNAQFTKIEKVCRLAEELDVDVAFLLGDVFDKARPEIWLVNKVLSHFRKFSCTLYSLVGNHDLQGCRDGVVGTGIGTLFTSGALKKLNGDCEILGIPFRIINHTKEHSIKLYETDTPRIILSHCMVTPQEAPFEHIYADDILKASKECFIFSGDFHFPFEKYNSITKSRIVNPGVVIRTSIAEKDVDPCVIYFEATPENLVTNYRRIRLEGAPGSKVFDVLLHEQIKEGELNLKQFIDSIAKTQFESQDIEKLIVEVGKENKISDVIISEAISRIKIAKASVGV